MRDHTKKGFIADYGKGGLDMEKKPDGEISTDYRAAFFLQVHVPVASVRVVYI